YRAAGLTAPPALELPIGGGVLKPASPPHRFITPKLDGLVTSYYEWEGAGHWQVPRGAAMGEAEPLLAAIHYGFDRHNLYVRLDPAHADTADDRLGRLRGFTVRLILTSSGRAVNVESAIDAVELPTIAPVGDPTSTPLRAGGFARLEIVELCVPFAALRVAPRQRVEWLGELRQDNVVRARYPRDGYLSFGVAA